MRSISDFGLKMTITFLVLLSCKGVDQASLSRWAPLGHYHPLHFR